MGHHHPNIHPDLLAAMDAADKTDGFSMNTLGVGDVLEVITENSTYRMEVVEEGEEPLVKVSGGRFPYEVQARVHGVSLTGTGAMIRIGKIIVGLRLRMFSELGTVLLSATRDIHVNGRSVVPRE